MNVVPRSRPARILLAAVGVLVLALLACEALGWPFLAGPLERQMSQRLHREVRLGVAGQPRNFSLHLLGHLRLAVDGIEIGAPDWSRAPYFLQARGFELSLPWSGVIDAARGRQLEVRSLQADRLTLYAQRREDGRASWQFSEPSPEEGSKAPLPRIDRALLREGEIHYEDVLSRMQVLARISLSEGQGAAPAKGAGGAAGPGEAAAVNPGLRVQASGRWRGQAFRLRARTAGLLPLLDRRPRAAAVPLTLQASAGGSRLEFAGNVADVMSLRGFLGRFDLSGPSLAQAGGLFGVTLPSTGDFHVTGRIRKQEDLWNVVFDSARIGHSDLRGAFTYDRRADVPLLAGNLSGRHVLLADLAPAVGAPTGAKAKQARREDRDGKLLPSREFNLPALQAMNANLQLDIQRLDLGAAFSEPLQPARAWLRLRRGVLAIGGIEARTARGDLAGELSLDGSGRRAKWRAALQWRGIRLAQWLAQSRGPDEPPYITGRLSGNAELRGQGRSTAEILGSLDGRLRAAIVDGSLSHLVVEAAGLDVAQALGVMIEGDQALPLHCAVADLKVDDGVVTPQALVLDTRDSTLFVQGRMSLRDETLDLKVRVEPKDFSPLALRTPVVVRGSFLHPDVGVEKGPLAARLGASALLALINPVAALIPLLDPAQAKEGAACQALLQQAAQRKPATR